MERDPQKVSAVLADPTRYRIYQYVLNAADPVPVGEVARRFGLHPNVGRMHLNRLADIGLLVAQTQKTGKGGRPGFVYGPSGNAVSLSVPARDFQLLADLLVQSLALTGEGGREAIAQIGHTFGRRLGREALDLVWRGANGGQIDYADILLTCAQALERLGVATHVRNSPGQPLSLVLRTCGFQEVASAHPEHICALCKSMVEGVAQACLEAEPTVVRAASRPSGDNECVYEVGGLIRLE